jgi:hypothetical protein
MQILHSVTGAQQSNLLDLIFFYVFCMGYNRELVKPKQGTAKRLYPSYS